MAHYHKNTPKSNTITIPVRELAMVSAFCLWNVIFFVWIMPGDWNVPYSARRGDHG